MATFLCRGQGRSLNDGAGVRSLHPKGVAMKLRYAQAWDRQEFLFILPLGADVVGHAQERETFDTG